MSQPIVVPTTNVDGNITSCKIETQQIKVDRSSAFSLRETRTFVSYDVCSRQQLEQFSVENFTPLSFILGVGIGIITLIVIMFFVDQY